MPDKNPSIINIALVGGGAYCKEILEKTTFDYLQPDVNAPILAVADSDPETPGMVLARQLGLLTFTDYHELYDPRYSIHLIILMTPDQSILEDILGTRPPHIRILSYHVFEVFWKTIDAEERKLRERNEEMETILNGIQDFIMVITPDRKILEINESFIKTINYPREEVIGRKCYEVFQRVTRKSSNCSAVCPLTDVIRNKRPSQKILTRVGPDGKPRYSELTVFPIWEKDGKISKFIEISRDITKRKKEEEEITRRLEQMVEERTRQLKETHNKLLHQDKMASLGKLSASVVHEINNPIAGILNLTMLIKRIIEEESINLKEIGQFNQYLNLMETETRRISRIVSNLLAFSRQSQMELKPLNLNQLIEKTVLLNSNLLKINKIKIKKRLSPNLPDLIGSEDQLQQVFMNVISNAVEAMDANGNGVLIIETRYSLKEGKVVVNFKDTGVGIPRENLSRLFEPFFTTKKKGEGGGGRLGLGLSVAYGIIEEHGGSIDVESKVGKGTTFKIKLPLKQSSEKLDQQGGSHAQH